MPTASPTKPGTRKLSEVARTLAVPSGITSTGWPSVARTCREKLGIEFDDWQHGAGRVILARRADGKLASTIDGIGMSLPRQIGKTYLFAGVLFALSIEMPGLLVIWSAHHARTHAETFLSMQGFAERSRVKPYVKAVYTGSGTEEVRFHNGSRILFGARERGFGRGIPGVDVLVFDEAQILSDRALANMLATMNTSKFGLHVYIGTPPRPTDESEAFWRMRSAAIDGTLTDGAWIECGADRGSSPDDRRQWKKANPSFPTRTPAEAFLRLRGKLTDADYLREALGVWDELVVHKALVSTTKWAMLKVKPDDPAERRPLPADDRPPSGLGLDMSFRRSIAISGAWSMDDRVHAEVLSLGELDTTTAVEWLKARAGRRIPVVVDAMSPAASMVPALEKAKVKVVVTGANEMGKACGAWFDLVKESNFSHIGQDQLNEAVAKARKRLIGKAGLWGLDRADEESDISSLVSVVLAVHGAVAKARPERPKRSRVMVMQ